VKEAAALYIEGLEALSESEMFELLIHVDRFSVPQPSFAERLREQCAAVVKLHYKLSLLRSRIAEKG
jgi:hypothetical protein